jgi:hypothetical protein
MVMGVFGVIILLSLINGQGFVSSFLTLSTTDFSFYRRLGLARLTTLLADLSTQMAPFNHPSKLQATLTGMVPIITLLPSIQIMADS